MKHPLIIYADLECLFEKMITYNNPEKSSTTKKHKIKLLVSQYLHIINLILQKISLIVIETKAV